MTRILGLDLITGSYIHINFATCLFDTINHTTKMNTSLSVDALLLFLETSTIDIIAVDHINELFLDIRLVEYLVDSSIEILQLSNISSHSMKLQDLARKYNISVKGKPNALKSAVICCLLALQEGILTQLYREDDKIKHRTGVLYKNNQKRNILNQRIKSSLQEITHRQAFFEVANSVFIDSIIQVIGYGKESIVFVVKDTTETQIIIKAFRTYSSISKRIYSQTYKAKIGHIPLLMARDEEKFLKILSENNIPVPKFRFRDDNLVGMELITNDLQIAPTLTELNSKDFTLGEIEDILYQALNMLNDLFSEADIVHGDFSANNLLFCNGKLILIDLAQSKQINTNTFTSTPQRKRMDQALDILFRDLNGILSYFEDHFRIKLERDVIFKEFMTIIPDFFINKIQFIISKWSSYFIPT